MSRSRKNQHSDRTTLLTTASVPIPAAVPVLQRNPDDGLRYRTLLRFCDSWQGWRDRRRVARTLAEKDAAPAGFRTDFVERLAAECFTRQEHERRTTRTAIAVLDDAIVSARHSAHALQQRLPDIAQRHADAAAGTVEDGPATSAEQYDTAQQRRTRRLRAQQAAIDAAVAERQQLLHRIDQAGEQIDIALQARRSHWAQLLVRVELLTAHYNRRARTYTRSASRRTSLFISTTDQLITDPAWCTPESLPHPPTE
ncbi:hypothetical protein [Rhodococcus sp. UFZ-B548]|uniref:hypothetical protein n=1 Tax=Rhodococcus sp. UFZ-B548 TaxID=2742212 RepID=UPI0015F71C50|nr:hypothetical protein [Rhodococcus sp. UFZ-B548]